MGTRGLYGAVVDGELRIAQYGQWDSYPGGQGRTVLEFCRSLGDDARLAALKDKVRKLKLVTMEEAEKLWQEKSGAQFDRDVCAKIFEMVLAGEATSVLLRSEFAADSLFCEWAYVIDLDNGVLEVFKGFQQAPHDKGRFADLPEPEDRAKRKKPREYYPVAEVARFAFDKLPDDNAFIAICEGEVLDQLANIPNEK